MAFYWLLVDKLLFWWSVTNIFKNHCILFFSYSTFQKMMMILAQCDTAMEKTLSVYEMNLNRRHMNNLISKLVRIVMYDKGFCRAVIQTLLILEEKIWILGWHNEFFFKFSNAFPTFLLVNLIFWIDVEWKGWNGKQPKFQYGFFAC
jgi:hypothetical protein